MTDPTQTEHPGEQDVLGVLGSIQARFRHDPRKDIESALAEIERTTGRINPGAVRTIRKALGADSIRAVWENGRAVGMRSLLDLVLDAGWTKAKQERVETSLSLTGRTISTLIGHGAAPVSKAVYLHNLVTITDGATGAVLYEFPDAKAYPISGNRIKIRYSKLEAPGRKTRESIGLSLLCVARLFLRRQDIGTTGTELAAYLGLTKAAVSWQDHAITERINKRWQEAHNATIAELAEALDFAMENNDADQARAGLIELRSAVADKRRAKLKPDALWTVDNSRKGSKKELEQHEQE